MSRGVDDNVTRAAQEQRSAATTAALSTANVTSSPSSKRDIVTNFKRDIVTNFQRDVIITCPRDVVIDFPCDSFSIMKLSRPLMTASRGASSNRIQNRFDHMNPTVLIPTSLKRIPSKRAPSVPIT